MIAVEIKKVQLTSDGSFNGSFDAPLSVGETVDTGYGLAKVAKILYSSEYRALGKGETYEEMSANAHTSYYYSVAVEGTLEIPKFIASMIYDLWPSMGDDPPEGD